MENKDFKTNFKIEFDKIASKFNIKYKNIDLYYEAFIHPTFRNEHKLSFDYERLEFLGDAILDFLVGEFIYKTKHIQEGDMTKLRAKFVCEQANKDYTEELNLHSCLMVGNGAKKQGEDKKDSVLGNLFESFLAALYLDLGLNEVRRILEIIVFPKIVNNKMEFFIDYKSKLQECIQAESRKGVDYIVVDEQGPAHAKTFTVIVMHDGTRMGKGTGKTKKEAEQQAAKDALTKLAK